ncbi:glutaredoxin-like isoform X1 [Cotesia glomerata]|uniref:Glutaredoxin-2, mitochondrial n=2 Tax=Cotesia glomerata TaxID=32391 RepID=A0AAV7IB15_COTGL|nr:glutaredoxin-like isoform X1 [Cotesia glomerata]KAH0547251.1 hypothetical protein KQX54_018067 [Cotesia glomerata]
MGLVSSSRRIMTIDKAAVQKIIDSDTVVIFSKSTCPYCTKAKNAFKQIGKDFKVIELDEEDDCAGYQDALGEITGARTVPRVFVNGKFIGGGDKVAEMLKTGELAKLFD